MAEPARHTHLLALVLAKNVSMLRMNSLHSTFPLQTRWPQRLGLLTLLVGLFGCTNVQTGAGVNIGVPILPGVSLGVNVGTGGISAGVNAHSGPVGVGVGVNGAGQVTGRAGVGIGVVMVPLARREPHLVPVLPDLVAQVRDWLDLDADPAIDGEDEKAPDGQAT